MGRAAKDLQDRAGIQIVSKALQALFSEKRVFGSEADFQFALAWKIKELYPIADIRLEYTPWKFDKNIHIDIVIFIWGQMIPVELKYKTKGFSGMFGTDHIYLKNQGAQDQGRYDFLLDIQRMERIIDSEKYPIQTGYAIFLTSDPSYWSVPRNGARATVDDEFRIHEGVSIHGERNWKAKTGAGTKRNREGPIIMRGTYSMTWRDYIPISTNPYKFTVAEIKK